nr:MAG TPA: hypothetical protein [Bacteriophage sp.]
MSDIIKFCTKFSSLYLLLLHLFSYRLNHLCNLNRLLVALLSGLHYLLNFLLCPFIALHSSLY